MVLQQRLSTCAWCMNVQGVGRMLVGWWVHKTPSNSAGSQYISLQMNELWTAVDVTLQYLEVIFTSRTYLANDRWSLDASLLATSPVYLYIQSQNKKSIMYRNVSMPLEYHQGLFVSSPKQLPSAA